MRRKSEAEEQKHKGRRERPKRWKKIALRAYDNARPLREDWWFGFTLQPFSFGFPFSSHL